MCRLSAFFGLPICAADLVTRPSHSIITQSFNCRERMPGDASTPAYLNGDGFGLGWYSANPSDITPCVYRQARPAWNDPNLGSIAEKIYTGVLFAHVRAASPGLDVSETTCHPFRYGRYLWMHNGGVGNFVKLRRRLLTQLDPEAFDFAVSHGSSDTALCFAIFLNLIKDKKAPASPQKLRDCMEKTIAAIEQAAHEEQATETSLLNFVVSDGESLVASRYVISLSNPEANAASLYYAAGNSYQSDGSAPGNYVMMHNDRRPSLAIVSSEPLTEQRADWVTVPKNHSIVITNSLHILLSPINFSSHSQITRILVNLEGSKRTDGKNTGSARMAVRPPLPNGKSPQSIPRSHPDETDWSPRVSRSTSVPFTLSKQAIAKANSPLPMFKKQGSTVRSVIQIPGRTVICSDVMNELLCVGTDDGSVFIWNIANDMLSEVLHPRKSAVMAILGDEESGLLFIATSASAVNVYRLQDNSKFKEHLTICCEGKGDILSLTMVGKQLFAGFSDARVRCLMKDITADYGYALESWSGAECLNSLQTTNSIVGLSETGFDFSMKLDESEHNGHVFACTTFLQNKYLCTGCGDGILRVWDLKTEKCLQARGDHAGAILALASYEVPQGSMVFSGSRDCSVKVWLWDGEGGFVCKRTLRKHKDEIVFLGISNDNLVSGSADGVVCVWSAETLALLCQYKDKSLRAGALSHSHNSLYTASDQGVVNIRDIVPIESTSPTFGDETAETFSHFELLSKRRSRTSGSASAEEAILDKMFDNISLEKPAVEPSAEMGLLGFNSNSNSVGIISEVSLETDDVDTLVPGVTNETILAPPICPTREIEPKGQRKSVPDGKDTNGFIVTHSARKERCMKYIGSPKDSIPLSLPAGLEIMEKRLMRDVLRRFVSFKSVSGSIDHREQCWQSARYIGNFLESIGASVKLVNTDIRESLDCDSDPFEEQPQSFGTNPIVLARFGSSNPSAKTITFYGHYDVIPVNDTQWENDPWTLTAIDGYFYGRGATDNKGPILAMIFAIKHLRETSRDDIGINIVMVLQGEGESSNAGFKACIPSHLHWFEDTSLILTSNSCWLGEEKPCITYGFRGVIELLVEVTGAKRNLHSGVDGGILYEPTADLVAIISTLVDASGIVCVPGFYEDVRELSDADMERLNTVDFDLKKYRERTGVDCFTSRSSTGILQARWRHPSLSITSIETSNTSGFYSVVPRSAVARISIRYVPDQNPWQLEKAIRTHLQFELKKRRSPNQLKVDCINKGDWWLGNPESSHFRIAEKAIREVWNMQPDYICEGGSMPLFSFLSKKLKAPLVQIPLGQSSDSAHLPNERIRAINLFRGKEVIQKIVQEFAVSNKQP